MAAITLDPNIEPSLATGVPGPAHQLMGIANATIPAGAPCTISGVTARDEPLFVLSDGAVADAGALVWGFAARDARAGEALTLYHDVEFGGYAQLTPGTPYYVGAGPAGLGILDDTPTTGGTEPVAWAVTAERIYVIRKLLYAAAGGPT